MSNFYIHYAFFLSLFTAFFLSLFTAFFLSLFTAFFVFSIKLYSFFPPIMFMVDWMAMWFVCVVLLISSIIMIYSYLYMSPYQNPRMFLWFTTLFVLSMLVVILCVDLFYVMLGWDGLGLVSFFLIIYYQTPNSIVSGLMTVLMNRMGDCFFITTIVMAMLYGYTTPLISVSLFSISDYFLFLIMLVSFMTKSAIYPFSSWLPMAMAAPTPISALVHSSTLVTSGLFLMMRFSSLLFCSMEFMVILSILGLFTSFYAGLNSLVETDFKKLIALSTLSHLGLICLSFSLGLTTLAFFHLLVHALFKSLLFMCMGDVMLLLNHFQDSRYLSLGKYLTPFSSFLMNISLLNLLGLASISGFFSKDFILESMFYSNSCTLLVSFMFILI